MTRFEIQRLRELPIEGVAERLGLHIVRHKCLCPFHDDHTPSLTFSVRRNTYRCYACGESGDTISLAMKLLPLWGGREGSFLEACKWLANENAVILTEFEGHGARSKEQEVTFDASRYARFFEHPFLNEAARHFLFEKRHLHPAVVSYCRLNSYKDSLQIPYYSQQRKLIGVQNRNLGPLPAPPLGECSNAAKTPLPSENVALPQRGSGEGASHGSGEGASRFRFPRGSRCYLYNLPVLRMLRTGEDLYIAEGPSDCWALLSSGRKAIAIPSATLFNRQEMLREFTEADIFAKGITLHIYPDKDDAGTYLYGQLLDFANDKGLCLVRHDQPEGCKDFADYWAALQALTVNR